MELTKIEPLVGSEEPAELVDEDEDERETAAKREQLDAGIGELEPEVGSITA